MRFRPLSNTLYALIVLSHHVLATPDRRPLPRQYVNTTTPLTIAVVSSTAPSTLHEQGDVKTDPSSLAISTTLSFTVETSPFPTSVTTPTDLGLATVLDTNDRNKTDAGQVKTNEGDFKINEGEIKTDEGQVKPDDGDVKTDDFRETVSTIDFTTHTNVSGRPRPTLGNYTTNATTTATTTQVTSCIPLKEGEASTVYIILPNPTTITVTLGGNFTSSQDPPLPEFTPPTYCPVLPVTTTRYTPSMVPPTSTSVTTTTRKIKTLVPPGGGDDGPPEPETPTIQTTVVIGTAVITSRPVPPVTTVITTSKNPVTEFTTTVLPSFPDGRNLDIKQTVLPNVYDNTPQSVNNQAGGNQNNPSGHDRPQNSQPQDNSPQDNSPQNGPSPANQPPSGVGTNNQGIPNFQPDAPRPVTTNVRGVPVEIGQEYAVISGTTVRYLDPIQTNIGDLPPTTNVVIVDGGIFSAVGSTVAVFDGQTVYYNQGEMKFTEYHQETITLGTSITFDGTTIGGDRNTGTKLGIAGGVSVTQLGQTEAIIRSTTLFVGPQAVVTTVFIDTYTIVANAKGLEIDGTTLSYPFMPVTQHITVGEVTITQIGASLLVLEGSTYTIGGTATTSIPPNNRQSITLGLTISPSTLTAVRSTDRPQPSPTVSKPPAQTSRTSNGGRMRPLHIYGYILLVVIVGISLSVV